MLGFKLEENLSLWMALLPIGNMTLCAWGSPPWMAGPEKNAAQSSIIPTGLTLPPNYPSKLGRVSMLRLSVYQPFTVSEVMQIFCVIFSYPSKCLISITAFVNVICHKNSTHAATPNRLLVTASTTFPSPWQCWLKPSFTCYMQAGACSHRFALKKVIAQGHLAKRHL